MAKITDILKNNSHKQLTFSFEVTPDLEEAAIDDLLEEPTFFSITWHAKSHQNKDFDIPPLRLAKLLRFKNKNVLLHLSCDLLRKDYLNKLLHVLQEHGICNIFVMLGENFDTNASDFKTSEELIKAIRSESGNYFCIGVAGMPDCSDEKLRLLKNKTIAGADFILTQAFFESTVYTRFSERCKVAEIEIPIIPGVFYFQNFTQLNGFVNLCKIKVSQSVLDYVKSKGTGETPGDEITRRLVQALFDKDKVRHIHFFTLNKVDTVSTFLQQLKNI